MDDRIQIQLLGIGAVKIRFKTKTIWIDAFNSFNETPKVNHDDRILFTHDDADHFLYEKLKGDIQESNYIFGPPSIVYPFYRDQAITPQQLKIYYPTNYTEPQIYEEPGLIIKIYNTEHFVNWHAVHISFLIEINNRRIYVTGDSHIRKENEAELQGINCIIYSLLNDSNIERKYKKYLHLWELIELKTNLAPKMIIGNHMIGCEWTINPVDLREIIEKENTEGIVIPTSSEEIVTI